MQVYRAGSAICTGYSGSRFFPLQGGFPLAAAGLEQGAATAGPAIAADLQMYCDQGGGEAPGDTSALDHVTQLS